MATATTKTLNETVQEMRRNALSAAIRNINVNEFGGKASTVRLMEYVAEHLNVQPYTVRLWMIGDGIPEYYVKEMLELLNRHSVWRKHQLFPSERLALAYMEKSHA